MIKVLITGPESTGKSTLSQDLNNVFGGRYVEEFARQYLNQLDRDYTETDLINILDGQISLEETAISTKPPFLFCDTGPEVIWVWSKIRFGKVAAQIENTLLSQHYDVRLICYPDLEWKVDPLRENASLEQRLALFEEYISLHQRLGFDYHIIGGQGAERKRQAIRFIQKNQNQQDC